MKRVLIIKVSSMGDIIHALPALSDAMQAYPDIQFDWVVEPGFQALPKWHPAVRRVIPFAFRKWRRSPLKAILSGEWGAFWRNLRQERYDAIIDAQGLLKTAWIGWFAKGPLIGLDFKSAREHVASLAYPKKVTVLFKQHAVDRARQLFSKALQYPLPQTPANYGINSAQLPACHFGENTLVFLHGTTWDTKHWPTAHWEALIQKASQAGFQVLLPWGSASEYERANTFALKCQQTQAGITPIVLPKLSLAEITRLMSQAKGIVAVDTGLCHIAAGLGMPTVSVYGPTNPVLTGAHGPWQKHLQSTRKCSPCLSRTCLEGQHFDIMPPCFETVTPENVWNALSVLMEEYAHSQKTTHFEPTAMV